MGSPKIIVFSSLFPNSKQPNAGVFIRERMFRVGSEIPIIVVSPVPWFPLQGLIRLLKPNYRPQPQKIEEQSGITIYHPRFFSIPVLFRASDGFFMALGSLLTLYRLKKEFGFNLIDAHFAFPDGYAATLLGKWFSVPVTITLRGTEVPLSRIPARKKKLLTALRRARKVFSVSDSLKRHVASLGAEEEKIRVIGNGVDLKKFYPMDRAEARKQLNIPLGEKVLISVGGLVERKGFHRVIELLPELIKSHPNLHYLIVGGECPEGNIRPQLEEQVRRLGIEKRVRFLGAMPSNELRIPLSAADLFVLATANEGWANVFLEAMGCGLPVITTDVGGNKEVICRSELGIITPFGEPDKLKFALLEALDKAWNHKDILNYAAANSWDSRVTVLTEEFKGLTN
ncbi:MAG: glycosyltransferase family 4 protein [Gammaproteobacteria bacterium]|nr:MAG: glycosyltransferase family 4 protein [Gammaproteobacteria bacterium]